MSGKPICIYHGNCFDGFTAAWAVWKRFGDAFEYIAGVYQTDPPDVTDRHVLIVDFSYKRPVLMAMAAKARSVIVLDHHKTAAEDLAGLATPPILAPAIYMPGMADTWWLPNGPHAEFDMNRSGAGMAWDYCHVNINEDIACARPKIIDHVEDRDLWRFDLPFTREIHAGMSAYPFDFGAWDEIAVKCEQGTLANEGAAIDRKHLRDIDSILKITKTRIVIQGHDVPIANMPVTMCSDAGNIMTKGEPFAVTYYDGPTHRHYSLRSTNEGVDVSEIAKQYGGGGHRNAAGFALPLRERHLHVGLVDLYDESRSQP